jgi:hypothetical protein
VGKFSVTQLLGKEEVALWEILDFSVGNYKYLTLVDLYHRRNKPPTLPSRTTYAN